MSASSRAASPECASATPPQLWSRQPIRPPDSIFTSLARTAVGPHRYALDRTRARPKGNGKPVYRGVPLWCIPPTRRHDPRPVSHVLFVVHGIGEALNGYATTKFPLDTVEKVSPGNSGGGQYGRR